MLDSNEVKESLGQKAKDIIANGLNLKVNRTGKCNCPLHNDKEPSMSWFKDGLLWKCHACGEQIDIYRYYTEFEQLTFTEAIEKAADQCGYVYEKFERKNTNTSFNKPKNDFGELSKVAIEYMSKRKISLQTLREFDVKQKKWNGKDVYVFKYYNEHNELEFVSYRKIGKCGKGDKGGCESNTKSILWNMNKIDVTKAVVIVEGQPDCMAVYEAGYKNVVSVPSGSNNLKWIEHCWEWLNTVSEFIVFADNDNSGFKMADEIKRRLKNVKVISHNKYKDANEVLYYEGKESLYKFIFDAVNSKPAGILDVSEMEYKSLIERQNGGIETGFIEYDSHVEDWKREELTVIFGRNGEGKTTFISQVIGNVINRGHKVFLYSGEMSDDKLQDWIYKPMAGNNPRYFRTVACKYRSKQELLPIIIKSMKQWHKEKLYLFDRNEDKLLKELDKFFNVMEIAARKFGVELFVIDNLMSILEESEEGVNAQQSNFVQECKNFAIRNKVHVVLLAHPNKLKKELSEDDEEGNLEKTDISGSNNIANKADNIISIERNFKNTDVDAIIKSLKDRESGQRLIMKFLFSKKTLRFYNDKTKENVIYGWEKKYNELLAVETANKRAEINEYVKDIKFEEEVPW